MALVVYPATGWNSFVDLARADEIIENFVNDNGWGGLDDTVKEQYLTQTALQISLCPNITLPDDVTQHLELAQCYLAVYAINADMIGYDPNEKAVNYEAVDTVKVAYDTNKKGSASDFPPIVNDLLRHYGCKKSSGGFSQTYAGRS